MGRDPGEFSRLGVLGLLVHDVQDHAAGGRAALGGGVDADGFFCRARVLLAVHVDPEKTTGWELGEAPEILTSPGSQFQQKEGMRGWMCGEVGG